MEVVVYDENINNINTYFNDYIIDHNQDISFRVYNKKLDVLYKDMGLAKPSGMPEQTDISLPVVTYEGLAAINTDYIFLIATDEAPHRLFPCSY